MGFQNISEFYLCFTGEKSYTIGELYWARSHGVALLNPSIDDKLTLFHDLDCHLTAIVFHVESFLNKTQITSCMPKGYLALVRTEPCHLRAEEP
jgi:hypothetical protein